MSLNNAASFVVQNPVNIKENKAIDVKVEHLQRNSHARAPSYLINPKTHQRQYMIQISSKKQWTKLQYMITVR